MSFSNIFVIRTVYLIFIEAFPFFGVGEGQRNGMTHSWKKRKLLYGRPLCYPHRCSSAKSPLQSRTGNLPIGRRSNHRATPHSSLPLFWFYWDGIHEPLFGKRLKYFAQCLFTVTSTADSEIQFASRILQLPSFNSHIAPPPPNVPRPFLDWRMTKDRAVWRGGGYTPAHTMHYPQVYSIHELSLPCTGGYRCPL